MLAVQLSVTVVWPDQAFRDAACEYRVINIRNFFDSGVQDMHRNRCTGEVSMTPGTVSSVCLPYRLSL